MNKYQKRLHKEIKNYMEYYYNVNNVIKNR